MAPIRLACAGLARGSRDVPVRRLVPARSLEGVHSLACCASAPAGMPPAFLLPIFGRVESKQPFIEIVSMADPAAGIGFPLETTCAIST